MLCKAPILMYHSIYVGQPHRGGVERSILRSHMQWLAAHNWQGVTMRELLQSSGSKMVGLTFDDGYENNLDYVLPLLKEFGFHATFFVCSQLAGTTLEWHHDDPQPIMGPDGWAELAHHKHEVASHGLTHRRLDQLNLEEIYCEVRDSRKQLEKVVGTVSGYAYPQGYFNEQVLKMVRGMYAYACTTRPRGRLRQDRWTLKRINIGPTDNLKQFKCKMSPVFRLACDLGY